jgi:hypothetical protein
VVRLLFALVLTLVVSACTPPAETGPPEGWQADGARWWRVGADTATAFRDLSSLEAMGVVNTESEFLTWAQSKMTDLYRTNPEVVDSIFTADVLPALRTDVPEGPGYQDAALRIINDAKRDFYQRYNHALRDRSSPPLAIPDSLRSLRGTVELKVYVTADNQPVAIERLQGTGTVLDDLAMRNAALATYTDAWVIPAPGKGGVKIPTWVYVTQSFGGA